jgi:hypothetical protein
LILPPVNASMLIPHVIPFELLISDHLCRRFDGVEFDFMLGIEFGMDDCRCKVCGRGIKLYSLRSKV